MLDLFERTPGWILGFGAAHPLPALLIVATLVSVAYVFVLKIYMALEDARDTRNRKL